MKFRQVAPSSRAAIRADLVEPIAALEEGFREAIRRRQHAATSEGVDLERL
ncbi:MAG: hypothetical protein ABI555_01245 [Chloroflexota bacterium]